MSDLDYVMSHEVEELIVDQDAPKNPYATGYGRRVPTRYRLKLKGSGQKLRVYMAQYGNSGSAYVMPKGITRFLHSDIEHDLQQAAEDLWKAEDLADAGIYSYSDAEVDIATEQALGTLLWVSTDEDETPMDRKYSTEDFPEEMRLGMKKLLGDFMEANLVPLVKSGHVAGFGNDTGKIEQIGHDYVLTTGGHGVGFWDRGLGELGDKLTEACHAERHEWYVFLDDEGELWCDDLAVYDAGSGEAESWIRELATQHGWTVGNTSGWGKSWKNLHIYKQGFKNLHVGLHRDGFIDAVSVIQRDGDPDSLRRLPLGATDTLRGLVVDYLNGTIAEPAEADA